MTPKFCPHCGASLRPGQIYCIECGTHLDEWATADGGQKQGPGEVTSIMNKINLAVDEGIASPDPQPEAPLAPQGAAKGTAADEAEASEAKEHGVEDEGAEKSERPDERRAAAATIVSPLAVNPHHEERFKGEDEWESGNRRYLIIIGAVALVAIGLVFILMRSCGSSNTDPQAKNVANVVNGAAQNQQSNSGQSSNSSSNSNSGDSSSNSGNSGDSTSKDDGETAQEKADHEKVKANLDKLDAEAEKVKAAVETYRTTHTKTRAEREQTAQEMKALADEVTAAQDSAKTSGIATSSKYNTANQSIVSCYDNLSAVMAEVNKFWGWDLGFNYPEYYPEQLTTPFEESCAATGTIGSALSKYDTTYRTISV